MMKLSQALTFAFALGASISAAADRPNFVLIFPDVFKAHIGERAHVADENTTKCANAKCAILKGIDST